MERRVHKKFFFTPTSLVFSLLALHYEKLV